MFEGLNLRFCAKNIVNQSLDLSFSFDNIAPALVWWNILLNYQKEHLNLSEDPEIETKGCLMAAGEAFKVSEETQNLTQMVIMKQR